MGAVRISLMRLRRLFGPATAFEGAEMDPRTLRFRDFDLERRFRAEFFRHTRPNIRFGQVVGIVLWIAWGFVVRPYMLRSDQTIDLMVRYGLFIPVLLVGFGLSFTKAYERIWEWAIAAVLVVTMIGWVYYVHELRTMPPDFGYVGLILITAFTYTLVRLRFVVVLGLTLFASGVYLPYLFLSPGIFGIRVLLATFYLVSFGALGLMAAYRLEQFTRLLFVRERQLSVERQRSDELLHNILPDAVIERLKTHEGSAPLAEEIPEVSVLFADAVAFTEQAGRTSPELLVGTLDELFRRFDELADRYGLEKIKTVGDAYMAVAGAPIPNPDHATAAAEMALAVVEAAGELRWPSGDPVAMRVGLATGPAVAGVIGQRKFAYDLWGDTVNLASRLETYGQPGRILVAEEVASALDGRYELGPAEVVDLKGRGPTRVRFLLGRRGGSRTTG